MSLALIAELGFSKRASVIDVGGGASTFVDAMLDGGFRDVTVLDVSERALATSQARLGARANDVRWIESDVTRFEPQRSFALWHDRAAFHFLADASERKRYVDIARGALTANGIAIIATFAIDGPTRCSGLDVVRYDPTSIAHEFGEGFTLMNVRDETHRTPWRAEQRFTYFVLRRE